MLITKKIITTGVLNFYVGPFIYAFYMKCQFCVVFVKVSKKMSLNFVEM